MQVDARAPRSVPASPGQRALWLLSKTLSDPAVYNEPNVYRLKGPLDSEALTKAINEVVQRHESLRTHFRPQGSALLQLIEPELAIPVPVTDLSALPPSMRETEARARARDEARATFDLEAGPLIRVRLLRIADEDHWLLMTRHHIVRDGTSDVVFAQELSALYAAYRSDGSPPLAKPPAQFSEHALRQNAQLQRAGFAEQLTYWRKALEELSVLELPLDRARPARPSHRGARTSIAIDPRLTRALRELAHAERTTLFTTLLASLQVLLFRYSGQDDIAIGVPVAGRPPGFEHAIGYFTNLVVVRGDLAGAPTFRQQLARTAERAREAYRHQEVPFATLVEDLAPRRDPSRNPLFQVSLVKATDPGEKPELAGLEVEAVENGGTGTVKFDIDFSVAEEHGTVVLGVEYATDLYRASTIEGMVEQWRRLLESIVERPDERIARLRLLDDGSRRRAVVEWNATQRAYPGEASIAALFAAQAQRTPGAIALTDGGRTLDYAALSRRSRALAHRLRAAGAVPGRRVAVCIERSLEEVVALLAVLQAGCAYVPLDPTHPPERIAALLADADAAAVLAVEASARAVPAAMGPPLLLVDDSEEDAVLDSPAASSAGDAVYVIYTSGTTGSPKGVVIPQRGVLRLVCGGDYVKLGVDDVVAHLSNPAFDAATFEVWGALLNGARLAVIPRDAALSPAALASMLDRENVTTLFVTTALFHRIAQDAPQALTGRQVLFGGEAAEPRWVARALREGRPRRLLHVYGPTEATTFATWHEVRDVDEEALTVPIGRPIANTEVYLLDGELEPVPPGVPGELWIGGPGLALGYLNDPKLTSERFVPHPFSAEPGARLYRTGDRARYRDDGSIEFLGRLDDQVKIRGFRIEPREIEAALSRLPDVRQALVVMHGSTSDTRRLSAYVVPKPGAAPTPSDLWKELRRTLPEYLVPYGIVILEALPMTSTGKIDRRALPDPVDLAQGTNPKSPPDTLIERLLAEIWKRLLGLAHVDLRESFFDLGGHSLLAAKMIEEIERVCGVRIPVTTLFTSATIGELAEVLRAGVPTPEPLVALNNPGGLRPPLFFLHGDFAEGGLYCRSLAAALGADQPFWAVHPHGLDRGALPASIEAMAADRVAAIQREYLHGPYFLGGHCNGALVAVEIARRLIESGEKVPAVVVVDGAVHDDSAGFQIGASPDDEQPPSGDAPSTEGREISDELEAIYEHYKRIIAHYAPEPFPGRIAVLRSLKYRRANPALGWAAQEIQTHRIPGGHLSAVTRHVATTAACIRGCLDAAYGRGRA